MFLFFFYSFFFNMPPTRRQRGKQWILRTCRKAGISWTDLCFCQASPPHGGGEGGGGWRGRGGVWEHLLHSSVIALLSSHSHSLMPTVHGFLSIRGLKGLHLRFFETVCQPIACNYKEWRKAVQRQHQHLYLALSWQPVTRFLFLPLTRKLGKQLPY